MCDGECKRPATGMHASDDHQNAPSDGTTTCEYDEIHDRWSTTHQFATRIDPSRPLLPPSHFLQSRHLRRDCVLDGWIQRFPVKLASMYRVLK